jgi:hypothetical protein
MMIKTYQWGGCWVLAGGVEEVEHLCSIGTIKFEVARHPAGINAMNQAVLGEHGKANHQPYAPVAGAVDAVSAIAEAEAHRLPLQARSLMIRVFCNLTCYPICGQQYDAQLLTWLVGLQWVSSGQGQAEHLA